MATKIEMDTIIVWKGCITSFNTIAYIVSPIEIRKADKQEIKQYYGTR